jgi:hypothetical protein
MIVTQHAIKRMSERIGTSKNQCKMVAKKAFDNGLTHAQVSAISPEAKQFLDGLYLRHRNPNNMKVWGQKVWLYKNLYPNDVLLITVVNLPFDINKTLQLQKQAL